MHYGLNGNIFHVCCIYSFFFCQRALCSSDGLYSVYLLMELECEKYREKGNSETPVCNHPDDYCQFRASCIIYFMEMENRLEKKRNSSKKMGLDKK